MARIIFLNIPAYGHVNSTLPVVVELLQRDHEVIYYNTADFQEVIATTGAQFRAYPASTLTPTLLSELASNLVNISLLLLAESLTLLPFLLDELPRAEPDVVVFDSICLWGMQATQLLALPSVSSITTLVLEGVKGIIQPRDVPFILWSSLPNVPRLFKLRRQLVQTYGKAVFPNKNIFPCVGEKNIVFTSVEYQPPTPFIDERFTFVGPAIAPGTRPDDDFQWDQLRDGTRIYVSLGTVNRNLPFLRTVLETFADYPAQFILSTGQPADLSAFGDVPENFLVRPSVPQLPLLEKVDLFITHGGNNSVQEGLYHGVPLLVVPQQIEQAANGRLVARLGAGIVVGDRPPYGHGIGSKVLRSAVDQLLSTAAFRLAAERLGASLRAAGGAALAADVIESML